MVVIVVLWRWWWWRCLLARCLVRWKDVDCHVTDQAGHGGTAYGAVPGNAIIRRCTPLTDAVATWLQEVRRVLQVNVVRAATHAQRRVPRLRWHERSHREELITFGVLVAGGTGTCAAHGTATHLVKHVG